MFISYAQNFEDVMLWKAFKDIDAGFYVDVGAMDPVLDSVTKVFYDRGWRGINIEPVASYYLKIVQARPNDINIQVAVSNDAGEKPFFEIEDSGLSTLENNIADRYIQDGRKVQEYQVKTETLNSILDTHALAPIHFLKVDVEGHEKEVLEGLDLNKWRPWIILIESTKPNTEDQTHIDWEPNILSHNYRFVFFDGLNRFYIADEHSGLEKAFSTPPNYFDNFITAQHHKALNELDKKQDVILNLEEHVQHLLNTNKEIEGQLSELEDAFSERQRAKRTESERIKRELENLKEQLLEKQGEVVGLKEELEIKEQQVASESLMVSDLKAQNNKISNKATYYYSEYVNVLHSRSWRITKPLRNLAEFFRRPFSRNRQTRQGNGITSLYYQLKDVPFVGFLVKKIKARYPILWIRIQNKLLSQNQRPPEENVSQAIEKGSPIFEDQKYFIELFNFLIQLENSKEDIDENID